MAMLVQSALTASCTAVAAGRAGAEALIAGLFDCLPLECRTAISFSTGLRYSSRRPFRVLPFPHNPASRRWFAHQPNVAVLDWVANNPCNNMLVHQWARFIERALSDAPISFLAEKLSQRRPDLTLENLPDLGLQLLEDFQTAICPQRRSIEDRRPRNDTTTTPARKEKRRAKPESPI